MYWQDIAKIYKWYISILKTTYNRHIYQGDQLFFTQYNEMCQRLQRLTVNVSIDIEGYSSHSIRGDLRQIPHTPSPTTAVILPFPAAVCLACSWKFSHGDSTVGKSICSLCLWFITEGNGLPENLGGRVSWKNNNSCIYFFVSVTLSCLTTGRNTRKKKKLLWDVA